MEQDKARPKEGQNPESAEYKAFKDLASKILRVPKDEAKTAKRAKDRPKA